jgi:cytochrome d ubiquinol oxidase subunit II
MIAMHGGAWLACKTEGAVQTRARHAGLVAAIALILLFALGGFWASQLDGYALAQPMDPFGPSNPLTKTVIRPEGALLANYGQHGWMLIAPALGFAGAAIAGLLAFRGTRPIIAFLASGLSIAGVIATAGVSLFPFLLPSSLDPNASLTIWDASSSRTTLMIMTVATAIFLPLVLAYTGWVYRVLRGPVTEATLRDEPHAY